MTTATPAIDLVSTMTTENEPFSSSVFTESSDENSSMVSNFVTTDSMTNMTTAIADTAPPFRFDDHTQRAIIGIIGCIVAVVGFIGNVLVILAVILSKKLQTRTNAFVVNLAAADLLTCILAPFHTATLLSMSGWPSEHMGVCAFVAAIGFVSLGCSIMNLAAIAINRYVLITKTMATYRFIYTLKKVAAMLVFTWVYPGVLCLLPVVGFGEWGYSTKYMTCSQDEVKSNGTSVYFSLVGSGMAYPIPLFVLSVCYYKIYCHVTGHLKKLASKKIELTDQSSSSNANTSQLHNHPLPSLNKRQVEITKNLFYVVCAFVVCLAPFAIALMIPPSDPAIPWTSMIIIFNSGVNPIIYGAKHPHFKEVFRHMLWCRCHMIPKPSSCLRKMTSR